MKLLSDNLRTSLLAIAAAGLSFALAFLLTDQFRRPATPAEYCAHALTLPADPPPYHGELNAAPPQTPEQAAQNWQNGYTGCLKRNGGTPVAAADVPTREALQSQAKKLQGQRIDYDRIKR